MRQKHIPVEVKKVMELEGAYRPDFNCLSSVYAHISKPVRKDGQDIQYAMLAIFPQHGVMDLGDINPNTRMFEFYDPRKINFAPYTRADNGVVNKVSVPLDSMEKLKTIDEVLGIEGISVKRELTPE